MADTRDFLELERRRVARVMQEKAENHGELIDALRKWNARAIMNGPAVIFPGDYVAVGKNCMCSSRGAMLDFSPGDLEALISSGSLSQVFDFDDLNAPDFADRVDAIMSEIAAQRNYQDAGCYYCSKDLKSAVAVYDLPAGQSPNDIAVSAAVERRGDVFEFKTDFGTGDVPMRQCSYQEFNPGGADIMAALQEAKKPEQGREVKGAYQRMMETYLSGGENEIRKPSEAARAIPGYSQMTPSEQMAAQIRLSDEYHKSLERAKSQEQGPTAADQWGPRLPGQRRMDP